MPRAGNAEMEASAGAVLRLHVEIGEPKLVGDVGGGFLTVIPITGGVFNGDGLSGRVLPGGADWSLRFADGSVRLHARYWIETDDGAVIAVENEGIAPSRFSEDGVSTTPRFTCDIRGRHAWLMEGTFAARVCGGKSAVDVVVRRV